MPKCNIIKRLNEPRLTGNCSPLERFKSFFSSRERIHSSALNEHYREMLAFARLIGNSLKVPFYDVKQASSFFWGNFLSLSPKIVIPIDAIQIPQRGKSKMFSVPSIFDSFSLGDFHAILSAAARMKKRLSEKKSEIVSVV
jgi:hypothetical protein